MPSTITRSSWLWVTDPGRLPDRAGREPAAVVPGAQVRGRHWWGCDRGTRAGDRALLCATGTTPAAYVVEVLSDARAPRPWEGTDPRWVAVCDYVVVQRVAAPAPADRRRWSTRAGSGSAPLPDAAWREVCGAESTS